MSLVIEPEFIEFESRTGSGNRVLYLGAPIVGLMMEVRPDASRAALRKARERAAHFLEEHLNFQAFLMLLREARHKLENTQATLSAVEHGALVQLGLGQADDVASLREALALQEQIVTSALTLEETSRITKLDVEELRERLEESRMLGVWCAGDHWRVLAFQVSAAGLLPGLEDILGRIPNDFDPIRVYAFFTAPQPTLIAQGRMVSPVEWLSAGADPEAVVELARRL